MSVIQRSKITKKVWFNRQLWDVIEILTPTAWDTYILVQRDRPDQIHPETNVHPINMRLIDCGNDEFYPDTDEVRKLMKKQEKHNYDMDETDEKLTHIWLTLFKNKR